MAHLRGPMKKHAGFSLIELLIALTIGLLLLAGLTLIFVNSSEANRELQKTTQQIENGRYAIDILSQDLRLAGFYGHFHVLPAAPAVLPDPCETASAVILQDALALPVQGVRAASLTSIPDVTAGSCDTPLLTAENLRAGSDVLVIRRAHTRALVAGTDSTFANEVYIQSKATEAEIQFGNGASPLAAGKKANGDDAVLKTHIGGYSPIRKYHVHVYFVAPCSVGTGANGVCQAGDDTIPTLKRLELKVDPTDGALKMMVVPLVEGIEYLKVEYGMDTNPTVSNVETGLVGDATVDSYIATPATLDDWTKVIAAKVYVLARNTLPTAGFTDDKTYTLGSAAVPAFNDNFRRHVFTAGVRLMNTSGRREIP